ncbi:hypothetical protein BU16DRAFT_567088 [Lophium mytilinum]|uniref:Uncharacterized protein n=1 Tax=Lophium mytilinum TaxID=390894 RepID=A0A6A6QCX7_9PEZI|nr:hypothetical protein BU16DRAFT_567088 [Lophium mytilinum]
MDLGDRQQKLWRQVVGLGGAGKDLKVFAQYDAVNLKLDIGDVGWWGVGWRSSMGFTLRKSDSKTVTTGRSDFFSPISKLARPFKALLTSRFCHWSRPIKAPAFLDTSHDASPLQSSRLDPIDSSRSSSACTSCPHNLEPTSTLTILHPCHYYTTSSTRSATPPTASTMSASGLPSLPVQPDVPAMQVSRATHKSATAKKAIKRSRAPGTRKAHYTAEENEEFVDPENLAVLLAKIIEWGLEHSEHQLFHLQHGACRAGYYRMTGGDPRGASLAILDWAAGTHDTRRIVAGIVLYSTPPITVKFAKSPMSVNLAPIAAKDLVRAVDKHPFNDVSPVKLLADVLCGDAAAFKKHDTCVRKMLRSAPHLMLKGATLCLILLYRDTEDIAQALSLLGNYIERPGIDNRIERALKMILGKPDVRVEKRILFMGAYRVRKRLQDDTIPAPLAVQALRDLAQSGRIPQKWFRSTLF